MRLPPSADPMSTSSSKSAWLSKKAQDSCDIGCSSRALAANAVPHAGCVCAALTTYGRA
jgi:hypothetical protein